MKVHMSANLYTKLQVLSTEYDIEIGGYLIGAVRNGVIYLNDLLIPSQNINSVRVEINPMHQIELLKKYGDKCKKVLGHWHSHHSMGCFWSPQDDTNMSNIMEYKDFFVFIVSSKGQNLIKVCVKKPFKFEFNNVESYLQTINLDNLREHVKEVIGSQSRPQATDSLDEDVEDD